MNIIEVVQKLKLNQKATRKDWEGQFYIEKNDDQFTGMIVVKKDFDKKFASEYELTVDDIVANDYEILEKDN